MLVDHHLHLYETFLDLPDTPFEEKLKIVQGYIDQALKEKIGILGFSEHAYLFQQAAQINLNQRHMSKMKFDLDEYVQLIRSIDSKGIKILLGLEVDYHPAKEKEIRKFIEDCNQKYSFDFLIGSVHSVDDWEVDIDPKEYQEKFQTQGAEKIYQDYYQTVTQSVKSELFDIIGHLDLIKIFKGELEKDIYSRIVEDTLDIIAQAGQIVEINTNGFNKPTGEQYPKPWILEKCQKRNIPITFSSDAHSAVRVGEHFEKMKDLVSPMGYEKVFYVEKKKQYCLELIKQLQATR